MGHYTRTEHTQLSRQGGGEAQKGNPGAVREARKESVCTSRCQHPKAAVDVTKLEHGYISPQREDTNVQTKRVSALQAGTDGSQGTVVSISQGANLVQACSRLKDLVVYENASAGHNRRYAGCKRCHS